MMQLQLQRRELELHRANFTGLMDLFDANYLRVVRLLPCSGSGGAGTRASRSRASGSPDLFFEIIEQHNYTTDLRLTYCFAGDSGAVRDPNAIVRVYHDARQAELLACTPGRQFRELHNPWVPSKDELRRRWVMNRFLFKWSSYLLRLGHAVSTFRPVTGVPGRDYPHVKRAARQHACAHD